MTTQVGIYNLGKSLRSVFEDALNFFMLQAEGIMDCDRAMVAAMLVREYGAGLEIVDELVNEDGRTFASPTSAATVRQALVVLFDALRGQYPLIRRRVAKIFGIENYAPSIGALRSDGAISGSSNRSTYLVEVSEQGL